MRRWHNETKLMYGRWVEEMISHEYDPADPPTDGCHCAKGIGSMRKNRTYDCGNARCGLCHWGKFCDPKRRANERRRAIAFDLAAG